MSVDLVRLCGRWDPTDGRLRAAGQPQLVVVL